MTPQSIAYASIAELPPHVGLYTAIMGSFVYIFLGTIKEVSIGPSSLMTLMTYSYTAGLPLEYVHLLCLLAGCVEFLMGILNLGFLVSFISAPVTSGFTSASAIIIMREQLKHLFGIRIQSEDFVGFIHEFGKHIGEYRVTDTVLGFCSLLFLLAFKYLGRLNVKNPQLKKTLWFLSICRNALIVIITTIMAGMLSKDGENIVKTAGDVRPGLPSFAIPSFSITSNNQTVTFTEMASNLGSGIIMVPVVAILANVAISKSFSAGKTVDATQEMMTLGICNVMGSMVGAMPTTGAFTRSAVNNASGVRTPMGGLYAGTIILLALSFLTPYFYYIPKATLAAVLISAVSTMVEYDVLPKLWKTNKFDFFVALITFFLSIFMGVERGLIIGATINMVSLVKLWVKPQIKSTICSISKGYDYIHITPELGLLFPAVDYLRDEIIGLTENTNMPVALDFTNIMIVDFTACKCLNSLIKTFKEKSQQLILLNVRPKVFDALKASTDVSTLHFYNTTDEIREDIFEMGKVQNVNDTEIPLLTTDIRNSVCFKEETLRKASLYDNVA